MKILFSLTYYTPYISGLTLYVKRLAEELVRNGYQSSVVSFQHERKLPEKEIVNGVEVIRARPIMKISKGFLSLDWLIKSFQQVKKSDIVILNLPQFEGMAPAILGRLFSKKVISIYHCEVVLPSGLFNSIVQIILTLSNLFTLFLSNIVVTYTEDFAKNSQILPIFVKKIRYIYPPVKEQKINKRVQKVFIDKITPKPKFVIGVAARLAAEKGIEYLFEALPQIKLKIKNEKLKIIIAGPREPVGEEEYKEKIMKLVEKYKEYIIFLGSLKEEEMGSFYSLIDVLVLPSINSTEAFGMVQIEAMMMGVPVVASDLPGVRIPIQKTGMGIIIPPKNSYKLAGAIVEILADKEKFTKDKKFIRNEFSFEKTINFYQKLIRGIKDTSA